MKTKGNNNEGCAPLCAQITGVHPQHETQLAGMREGVLTFKIDGAGYKDVSFGEGFRLPERGRVNKTRGTDVMVRGVEGAKCEFYGNRRGMTLVEMCADAIGNACGPVRASLVGIC